LEKLNFGKNLSEKALWGKKHSWEKSSLGKTVWEKRKVNPLSPQLKVVSYSAFDSRLQVII